MREGIDVSSHQGSIDWKKVKNAGIDFAILRASIGDDEDKTFADNVALAKDAGVEIVGVYHFSYAINTKQAEEEAEFCVSIAKRVGLKDIFIFFDFEYEGEDYVKSKNVDVTPEFVKDITGAFCNKVRALGFKPGVYANGDYYNRFYNKGKNLPNDISFFYADWRTKYDDSVVKKSDFFQYTSTGQVDGIKTNVDRVRDVRSNDITTTTPTPAPKKEEKKLTEKDINRIANDVIAGKYGNGDDRKKRLADAGYDYSVIQKKVNDILAVKKPSNLKPLDAIVAEVIAGRYGNGDERKKKLEAEGYDYRTVQNAVNKALTPSHISVSPAKSFDKNLSGKYVVKAEVLNLRYVPGLMTGNNIMKLLYKNEEVQCWGYYTDINNTRWLYVQKGNYTGHIDSRYVKKV